MTDATLSIPYTTSDPSNTEKHKKNVIFQYSRKIDPSNLTNDDAVFFANNFTNNCDVVDGRKINKKNFTTSQLTKLSMVYLAFDLDHYINKPIEQYTFDQVKRKLHTTTRRIMTDYLDNLGVAYIWYAGINDGKMIDGYVKESTHFVVFFDFNIDYKNWSEYKGHAQVLDYLSESGLGCDHGPLCVNQHLKPGHGKFGFKNGKPFPVSTFFKREIPKNKSIKYQKELTVEQQNFHDCVVKVDAENLNAVVSDVCHNIAAVQDKGILTNYYEWSYLLAGGIKSILGDDGIDLFVKASSTYMDGKDDVVKCDYVYNNAPSLSVFALMTVYDFLMARTKLPENRIKSTTLKNTFIKLSGLGRFDVYDIIRDSYKMKSKMSRIIYTESNGNMNIKEIIIQISQHYKVPYEVMRSYYRYKIFDKKTDIVDENNIRQDIVNAVYYEIQDKKYILQSDIKNIMKKTVGSYKSRTLTLKSINEMLCKHYSFYATKGLRKIRLIDPPTSLETTQSTPILTKEPIMPPMPSISRNNDIYMADEITGVVSDEDGVIIVIDQEDVMVDYDREVIKKDYWGTEISRYTVPDRKIVGHQNVGHIFNRKFNNFDKMMAYQAKLKSMLEIYGLDSNGRPIVDLNIKKCDEILHTADLETCWAVDEITNKRVMYA